MKLDQKYLLFLHTCIALTNYLHGEYPDTFVEDGIIVNELKTEEYIELVRPFLPENPLILEAGSHGGEDTVILSRAWPQGFVYGFEPVLKFVNSSLNVLRREGVRNAQIFPYALAMESGKKIFNYSNHIGAASSLLPSNETYDAICRYNDAQMVIDAVNLDEWCRSNNVNHIDFMWLDMEGYEYYVLNSAPNILKTVKAILTEVNFLEFRKGGTQFKDLNTFLTDNGFKLYRIWGSPVWQGNAIYIKKELLP